MGTPSYIKGLAHWAKPFYLLATVSLGLFIQPEVRKLLYLVVSNISAKWRMPQRGWKVIQTSLLYALETAWMWVPFIKPVFETWKSANRSSIPSPLISMKE